MRFAIYVMRRSFLFLLLFGLLNACTPIAKKSTTEIPSKSPNPSTQTESPANERYLGKDKDWGPGGEIDMSHIPDAIPRFELRTLAGNKNPYTILGSTYSLLEDERNYKERGKASWYGYKFNGELTSNGELYNMFSMTAAHKTLPIPSYVRVTNLSNQNSVVVRVNDRGPFHEDRIIDLSYAAAQRLGITQAGTGNVEVEIVVPDDDPRPPLRARKKDVTTLKNNSTSSGVVGVMQAGALLPEGTYLQIAAFAVERSAQQYATDIAHKLAYPVVVSAVKSANNLFRVRVGPLKDSFTVQNAREQLQKMNILQALIVYQ